MDTLITKEMVAAAVYQVIPQLACELPKDIAAALNSAYECERGFRGRAVLSQLVENAQIAQRDQVPLCQDTGTVWLSLEVGPKVQFSADVFSLVDEAVARAYQEAKLRKSLLKDALFDRSNTQDNTPAFCDIHLVDEPGCARLHLMLKGGGSDNASRVLMLPPGAGRAGIVDEVVRCVREKGANACPPLVLGVGIGSTFDKVASLAKRALMRPLDEPAPREDTQRLEEEILAAVNASGVGPGGLGGDCAALGVRVLTAPCHIAALPLAINMGCCAMRRTTIDLVGEDNLKKPSSVSVWPMPSKPSFPESQESPKPRSLKLPLDAKTCKELKAGQVCFLNGPLYTLRDAGHVRLMQELKDSQGVLPYGLCGQTIFYAGPTPPACGKPFGAIGPTTASRMDFAAPTLHQAGVVATVGKGHRSEEVRQTCRQTASVYFIACGGAAALLAQCVASSETVAYEDLGTEALRRVEVVDFPVFVGIDTQGNDVFDLV